MTEPLSTDRKAWLRTCAEDLRKAEPEGTSVLPVITDDLLGLLDEIDVLHKAVQRVLDVLLIVTKLPPSQT